MEENDAFGRLAGMKRRRLLFGLLFAGLVVVALLGAAVQALRGSRPALLASV